MKHNKPTSKQERYVQELVKGKSQRVAYRIAHPISKKWADNSVDVNASRALAKPKIKLRFEEVNARAIKEAEDESIISKKGVLQGLANIAGLDIRELFGEDNELVDIKDIPEHLAKAISGIEIDNKVIGEDSYFRLSKIKTNDRLKALELLGKHLGMFTEKIDLTSGGDKLTGFSIKIVEEKKDEKA